MTATLICLAADRQPRPATTAVCGLGEVVLFIHRETATARAKGDLLAARETLDRAAARLADAEARGVAPAEVAFLRRLWRTARVDAKLATARHSRAHVRAA